MFRKEGEQDQGAELAVLHIVHKIDFVLLQQIKLQAIPKDNTAPSRP